MTQRESLAHVPPVTGQRAPTGPEMASALRAVNPLQETLLVLRGDVHDLVVPIYSQLARECATAERDGCSSRAAWRRWRRAIAPIAERLEREPVVPVVTDPFDPLLAN